MTKVNLVSFGHRCRRPPPADVVVNCRDMPNPWVVSRLRDMDGRDKPVQDFLVARHDMKMMVADVLLAAQKSAGELTVAFGCTGGRHRSVATVEMVAESLRSMDLEVTVRHMELAHELDTVRTA